MPPMVNVTMNPIVHSIGSSKRIRPRNMVSSQLINLTPVGTAMIMVMIPKNALTLAVDPMVKKWCSQTKKLKTAIAPVATTILV